MRELPPSGVQDETPAANAVLGMKNPENAYRKISLVLLHRFAFTKSRLKLWEGAVTAVFPTTYLILRGSVSDTQPTPF